MKLASAEELAVAIDRKYSDHGEIAALSLAPDMIREYARAVLEAAIERVVYGTDDPRQAMDVILKLKEEL